MAGASPATTILRITLWLGCVSFFCMAGLAPAMFATLRSRQKKETHPSGWYNRLMALEGAILVTAIGSHNLSL